MEGNGWQGSGQWAVGSALSSLFSSSLKTNFFIHNKGTISEKRKKALHGAGVPTINSYTTT